MDLFDPEFREKQRRIIKMCDDYVKNKLSDPITNDRIKSEILLAVCNLSWKDYPDERFDVNNGQTLCFKLSL